MLGKVYHLIQKYKFESKSQRHGIGSPALIQKYKFESKSQQMLAKQGQRDGCITSYKNTNLKANHNSRPILLLTQDGVSPNTKIQI